MGVNQEFNVIQDEMRPATFVDILYNDLGNQTLHRERERKD